MWEPLLLPLLEHQFNPQRRQQSVKAVDRAALGGDCEAQRPAAPEGVAPATHLIPHKE
jgi:hypothetical protein